MRRPSEWKRKASEGGAQPRATDGAVSWRGVVVLTLARKVGLAVPYRLTPVCLYIAGSQDSWCKKPESYVYETNRRTVCACIIGPKANAEMCLCACPSSRSLQSTELKKIFLIIILRCLQMRCHSSAAIMACVCWYVLHANNLMGPEGQGERLNAFKAAEWMPQGFLEFQGVCRMTPAAGRDGNIHNYCHRWAKVKQFTPFLVESGDWQ